MKVLLVGATGNVGLRLVASLLTHGHSVVTYVRSSSKLESLVPASVYQQITVVEGDATHVAAIKKAILDHNCDAVVNSAGVAAMAPWGKSDLPAIFRAVVDATQQVGLDRKKPLRAWFLGGMGVLYYPGSKTMLSTYVPMFLTHRQNIALLDSLPPNSINWSMFCPAVMIPESSEVTVPTKASPHGRLVANEGTPALWQDSWLRYIPLIGRALSISAGFGRYTTTLEQCTDFIAEDLESADSKWIGARVGIIDGSK